MGLEEFKRPIDKEDFKYVFINGLLAGILGGILGGVIDYLFYIISFPLTIGLIVIVGFVIWRMKLSMHRNHILYSCLGVLFVAIGIIFSEFAYLSVFYITSLHEYRIYMILAKGSFWLSVLKLPIAVLINGIQNSNGLQIFYGLIDFVIYVWAFVFTFISIRRVRR